MKRKTSAKESVTAPAMVPVQARHTVAPTKIPAMVLTLTSSGER
jgi:hypothetical protein